MLSDFQSKGQHLLVISDTSTISFPPNSNREALSWVGLKTNKTGFGIHPSILVNAKNGACYGLGGLSIHKTEIAYTEEEKQAKKKKKRDNAKRPFQEKESSKWITSPKQAIENCPGAANYTLVGDRESDVYDVIARALQGGWQFVIRSKTNRCLSDEHEEYKMSEVIDQWDIAHSYQLDLIATKKRTSHTAEIDLKFGQLSIERPHVIKDKQLAQSIPLQVVEVKERDSSVVGNETPIHWIILTSHPVNDVNDALQIVQWYQWRWIIEQLFRSLKNKGLNIEASQVETFHGLINLTTMALLAAVQIMQLVQARDGNTDQNIDEAFFKQEREC
ncbi:MAG: IS4 family transposase [Saprospiraceae bacterium]